MSTNVQTVKHTCIGMPLPTFVALKFDLAILLSRIGRTGRFGRNGLAINFVDGQRSMSNMREIEKHFGRAIVELNTEDPDVMEQAVAS